MPCFENGFGENINVPDSSQLLSRRPVPARIFHGGRYDIWRVPVFGVRRLGGALLLAELAPPVSGREEPRPAGARRVYSFGKRAVGRSPDIWVGAGLPPPRLSRRDVYCICTVAKPGVAGPYNHGTLASSCWPKVTTRKSSHNSVPVKCATGGAKRRPCRQLPRAEARRTEDDVCVHHVCSVPAATPDRKTGVPLG